MRTTEIEIGGKIYPLCFSLLAMCAFCEKYGSLDGAFQTPSEKHKAGDLPGMIGEYLWQLHQLLLSGQANAEINHLPVETPPPLNDLYSLLNVADLNEIQLKISEAIAAGSRREVKAEPGKNTEATSGNEST